jgi:hypothetical protein
MEGTPTPLTILLLENIEIINKNNTNRGLNSTSAHI